MLSLDLFGAPTARCGDGVVTLDFDADAYSCHYYPVEHGWEAGAEPLLPIWREPEVSDDRLEAGDPRLFLRAWCAALTSFFRKPIRSLMMEAMHLGQASFQRSAAPAQNLAAGFERMSLYLPYRASCLLRAYALLHYLSYHGHRADWVIGVQLFPFRAHCWLAIDDMLIGERVHLIEDYVPIFRLRQS